MKIQVGLCGMEFGQYTLEFRQKNMHKSKLLILLTKFNWSLLKHVHDLLKYNRQDWNKSDILTTRWNKMAAKANASLKIVSSIDTFNWTRENISMGQNVEKKSSHNRLQTTKHFLVWLSNEEMVVYLHTSQPPLYGLTLTYCCYFWLNS